MKRKTLALIVVLIVTGLAPATAVLGFCARMPCCFTQSHLGPILSVGTSDCCNTISCYEVPPHESTASAKAHVLMADAPAVLPAATLFPARPAVKHVFVDLSPPRTTGDRLAALSVLLI